MLFGDVSNFTGKKRNRIIQLTGEKANAQYLTWNQVPDTVKLELEGLTNKAYDLTNTPRISPQELKGLGNAISGRAFRYIFMGAHMAVSNHAEVIGEFFQRRINFLVSALADVNPSEFNKASQTIDIDVDLVPYMIDDIDERVTTAVSAIMVRFGLGEKVYCLPVMPKGRRSSKRDRRRGKRGKGIRQTDQK